MESNKNSRRENLTENYEDAAFALMMDELMQENGKKWEEENERLKSDPGFSIPAELDKKCLHTINRHLARQKRAAVWRRTEKIVSRVAVAFLILCAAVATPFCTVSAFRNSVMNLVTETFDTGTYIYVQRDELQKEEALPAEGPTWFPPGDWHLTYSMDEEPFLALRYVDTEGDIINYTEATAQGTGTTIDTEDALVKHVTIQGNDAILSEKGNQIILSWADAHRELICYLDIEMAETTPEEATIIKMAESIG